MSIREIYIATAILLPMFSLILATALPIFSFMNLLTIIVISFLTFFLLVFQPKIIVGLPYHSIYFFVFLSYVSLIWLINEKDLQNTYTLSVFILYLFVILFTSTLRPLSKRNSQRIISFLIFLSPFISIFFIITGLAGSTDPVTPQILLIFASLHCAKFQYDRKLSSLLLFGLCLLGASFTANRMIVLILIFLLLVVISSLFFNSRSSKGKKKNGSLLTSFLLIPLFIIFFWLILIQGNLQEAFVGGDNAIQYGDIALNTSGRLNTWIAILNDPSTSLWTGSGNDMPAELLSDRWRHPHNDYLRVYSRSGIIGLILFLIFLRSFFSSLLKSSRAFKFGSLFIWNKTALYLFISCLGMMITDNTLVYPSIMVPTLFICTIATNTIRLRYK